MAGMKEIKARIKSVESTMQITKAMELVATSKLRRAKENVERTRPFYHILGEAINEILAASSDIESDWFLPRHGKKTLFILFAGDRGLAGGYNSNVFKVAAELSKDVQSVWLPIGKKALEHVRHKKLEVYSDSFEYAADQGVGCMLTLGSLVADGYRKGEYDRVVMIFTEFVSMMTQKVVYEELLPLTSEDTGAKGTMETDCDPAEMLDRIVPEYIGGILYSALCESLASESGARRAAMNSANKNAEEMIGTLMLKYNRARQAVITQEITEIVSGAEAL
ncbi:MAG: ATP synthase F1 subunit gamma [Clostridia bacterium]|nr:ATP synthase F1 subunit gamma [Clostridia bacterium]